MTDKIKLLFKGNVTILPKRSYYSYLFQQLPVKLSHIFYFVIHTFVLVFSLSSLERCYPALISVSLWDAEQISDRKLRIGINLNSWRTYSWRNVTSN